MIKYLRIRQPNEAPTKQAIYSSHEQINKTYRELNDDVNKVANSLVNDFLLKKGDYEIQTVAWTLSTLIASPLIYPTFRFAGDVIALWSANSYSYVLVLYAGKFIFFLNR